MLVLGLELSLQMLRGSWSVCVRCCLAPLPGPAKAFVLGNICKGCLDGSGGGAACSEKLKSIPILQYL
jgi:hypothetical protein